jgi:DtxR family Mn-dependent transcriptional regulator
MWKGTAMRLSTEAEEVLQALFSMEEEGASPASAEALLARARVEGRALREAADAGFVVEDEAGFRLAPPGRPEAAILARRHRLAERLLHDVLRVRGETAESTACEVEHFLEVEVVESICTLLGHPSVCPHGKPIPPGECCNGRRRGVGPAVERLSELSAGDSGTVAYAHTTSPGRLDRLASFGLLPGTAIQVHQTWPSVVVEMEGTELAFDKETSKDIFVRRSGAVAAER